MAPRRGLSAAALAAMSCSPVARADLEGRAGSPASGADPPPRKPPPVSLNQGVADAAAIYVAFLRSSDDPAWRLPRCGIDPGRPAQGFAHDADQLSRG